MAYIYCIMPCTRDFAHESSISVNTCKTRVNARSSQGTVVIVIECKESIIIVNESLVFINTVVTVLLCAFICV